MRIRSSARLWVYKCTCDGTGLLVAFSIMVSYFHINVIYIAGDVLLLS